MTTEGDFETAGGGIVTLCGSARFEAWFHAWIEALGLAGRAAFGPCAWPSRHGGDTDWYTAEQKAVFDAVHVAKIGASDAVLVLNPFAYVGDSTLREIRVARACGARLYALESWGLGLGIGPGHAAAVRQHARSLGVPAFFGSPIDTTAPAFRSAYELLGPAGEARSAVVDMLTARGMR